MPRVQLKMPKKNKKTPNLGKSDPPRAIPAPAPAEEETPEVTLAKAAVEQFEAEYEHLKQMRKKWAEDFTDANNALGQVKQQEDHVSDLIKKAKPLVAKAKRTIGPFLAQRKWKAAHYDEAKVTEIVSKSEDGIELFAELLAAGLIQTIAVDSSAMTSWCAQNPALAERFLEAWKEEEEQTTAVTIPKI